jgi:uncharacterized repeat protein (TIGR01451 family)
MKLFQTALELIKPAGMSAIFKNYIPKILNPMDIRLLKILISMSVLFSMLITPKNLHGQCAMACNDQLVISIKPGETFDLRYDFVLEGTICPGVNSFSSNPADSVIQLSGDNPGSYVYEITNLPTGTKCWGNYTIVNPDCNNDVHPPVILNPPPSQITIGCNGTLPNYNLVAYDDCDDSVVITESTQIAGENACYPNRVIAREWRAYDDAGNSSFVTQNVRYTVDPGFEVDLPGDNLIDCGSEVSNPHLEASDSPCSIFGESYEDQIINSGGCSRIVRTHYLLDWCAYSGTGPGLTAPSKDIDLDGLADPYTIHTDGINWYDGTTVLGPYTGFLSYTSEIRLPQCSEPYADCRNGITITVPVDGSTTQVWGTDFNEYSYADCSFDNLEFRIIWADSSDQSTPPSTSFYEVDTSFIGVHEVEMWVKDSSDIWAYCTSTLQIISANTTGPTFYGNVFQDMIPNCQKDGNEVSLDGWIVVAEALPSGNAVSDVTDSLGNYSITLPNVLADTAYEVYILSTLNYGQGCQALYHYPNDTFLIETFNQNFGINLVLPCPSLSVDITAPFLRRCFPGAYTVSYCNYGAQEATDAYVEVELDDFLNYTATTGNLVSTNGNLYTFSVGDVPAGDCGTFLIHFDVDCDAELGQSHCSEAHIYPDTTCFLGKPEWDGSSLAVTGFCDGDTIRMKVENVGTGAMTNASDYIIVEDVIMYRNGNFQLGVGEEIEFPMAANGATWRLEVEQVPFHPVESHPSVTIEGCGTNGNGSFTMGVLTLFEQNEAEPYIAVDCQENIGSYDPNDKQAFPKGYGNANFVKPGTPLEYMIRFQNTGTDTAFTVKILDQLSEWLDPATVRPGASSHDYTFKLHKGGLVEFLFNDILLPDSTTNEPASNGFVKFTVETIESIPLGTEVENFADIYFDFNEPVRTNTVLNTIGENFITVKIHELDKNARLEVYPNPLVNQTTFELQMDDLKDWELQVYNLNGQLIRQENTSGNTLIFERGNLANGVYYFRVVSDNHVLAEGKLVATGN